MKELLLLPNVLGENQNIFDFVPIGLKEKIKTLDGLIAESEKSARAYLRKFLSHEEVNAFHIELLNEHTKDFKGFLKLEGIWGLISDAGLSCIADPGSKIVELCHQNNIPIEAISGPSSIILALMLSGFSAQEFCFNGYLPREDFLLEKKIRLLNQMNKTQIFIEAPYRNEKLLEKLLKILNKETWLCLAMDLTMPSEEVIVKKVKDWKKISFNKRPCVFLIY